MKRIAALFLSALLALLLLAGCQEAAEPASVPVSSQTEPASPPSGEEEPVRELPEEEPVEAAPAEASSREPGGEPFVPAVEIAEPAESIPLTIYSAEGVFTVEAAYYEGSLRGAQNPLSFSIYYDDTKLEPVFVSNAYRFILLPEPEPEPEEGEELPEEGVEEAEAEPAEAAEALLDGEESEEGEEGEEGEEEEPVEEPPSPEPVPPMERTVYLEVSLINGATVNSLAPTLADGYLDFTDIEFTSFSRMGAQRLEASRISAGNGEQYLEAYLTNVSGGVAVVVLSVEDSSAEDLLWFRAMLSTFRLF